MLIPMVSPRFFRFPVTAGRASIRSLTPCRGRPKRSWKEVSWRRGTKGRLTAHFAVLRIRIADGSPHRIFDKGQQHMPGEAALKQLATAIKARWVCEQAHQQMKEELGLDHFEGRSWQGLHRHALMTMIAYAFLQHQRLHQVKREKSQEARPA